MNVNTNVVAHVNPSAYKDLLLEVFVKSKGIVSAIDSQQLAGASYDGDDLIYVNIFPYHHIPDTQTKADAYLMFSLDCANINRSNATFADMKLTVWTMSHQTRMKLEGIHATRTDFLAQEVIKLLDGSKDYGFGMLELQRSSEIVLSPTYQYRELIFLVHDFRPHSYNKVGRI